MSNISIPVFIHNLMYAFVYLCFRNLFSKSYVEKSISSKGEDIIRPATDVGISLFSFSVCTGDTLKNNTVVRPIPTLSPVLEYFDFISGVEQSFGELNLWPFLPTFTE